MKLPPPPPWLANLQAAFSDAIERPMDASSGTFMATVTSCDCAKLALDKPAKATPVSALAAYQRMRHVRYFDVLQKDYPLAARLLGLFRFNGWASAFILSHPSRSANVGDMARGFRDFVLWALAEARPDLPLGGVPRQALEQAVTIDHAWATVLVSRDDDGPYLGKEPPTDLARLRLSLAAPASVVTESWPLLDLRRSLLDDDGEGTVPLPPRHAEEQTIVLLRQPGGILEWRLSPHESRILRALRDRTVAEGLALAEAEARETAGEEGARAVLLATQRLLGQGRRLGLWRFTEDAPLDPVF